MNPKSLLPCLLASVASNALAAEIIVSGDITTSVNWTNDNVYRLSGQVFVMPGATITIEAGTVIASDSGGSLAITRGAMLDCRGTAQQPIIFTSKTDHDTWNATNPYGQWRAACNEWGNLTIMGDAYIGKYGNGAASTNTAAPNSGNYANMEGLVASGPTDTRVRYGGGNDNDDSGSLRYTSFRYGGKVVSLGTELNGLSLGGVGRGTEIDHIDIMNNVDDGIEIWGGTVDLKYFSIWNIGDDSFDLDQGWRGRGQFGLLVAGYSVNAASGSGVCDKLIEIDGAEKSDAQPVTTTCLYNMTLIGQPASGKKAIGFRDNARMQLRNSLIMDSSIVIANDNTDNEATGGQFGYGYNGTLTWANTWTTNWNAYSSVNPFATPASAYTAQSDGKLIDFKDDVFYGNSVLLGYTEADARGVFTTTSNNNLKEPTSSPITRITRGPEQTLTGVKVSPVIGLDPRPANSALTAVGSAPNNGFFTSAAYRGAFAPGENWLCGWTAASQYGYTGNWNGTSYQACAAPCAGDLDGSGSVDAGDIGSLLILFGDCGSGACPGDLDGSRSVDAGDIGSLLILFGNC